MYQVQPSLRICTARTLLLPTAYLSGDYLNGQKVTMTEVGVGTHERIAIWEVLHGAKMCYDITTATEIFQTMWTAMNFVEFCRIEKTLGFSRFFSSVKTVNTLPKEASDRETRGAYVSV